MAHILATAALLLAACVTAASAVPLASQLVVHTASGPVQGAVAQNAKGDVRAFLGIPFAKPPLGDLRFREPQPVESWQEPLPCINYAPGCYQGTAKTGAIVSEDCLYLNVWTPVGTTAGDDLPVLVFLHGGAFSSGQTNDKLCRSMLHALLTFFLA